MQIEIDSKCNFSCKNCYRKLSNRKTGHMTLELFKEIVDKLKISELVKKQMFIAGFGESMINPNFWEMVKYAKKNFIYLMLPTNGSMLNEETIPKLRMVDQVQLSVDSISRNEELRGGKENPLKWIPLLQEYRVPVQLNVTINSNNIEELYSFIKFAMRNNLHLYLMYSVPFFDKTSELEAEYKYLIKEYNNLLHKISQYHVSAVIDVGCNTFERCRYINNDFAIDWEGNIFPCNDGLLSDYKFGHISNYDNFDQVMESEELQLVAKGKHPLCRFCKQWDKYWQENYREELIYDKRLDYYHNLHKGKRCFVVGNSISFTKEIADLIKNEITIGANFIAHAIDKYNGFKPTYCCIGDADMILVKEHREFLDRLECPIFYPNSILDQVARGTALSFGKPLEIDWTPENLKLLEDKIAVNYLNPSIGTGIGWASLVIPNKDSISLDLRKGVVESGTVVQQMMIPLASWLGCNPIYLVGIDGDGHFYQTKPRDKPFRFGLDVVRQFGWYQSKLKELGQIMYKIGTEYKFQDIDNLTKEEVFGALNGKI